MLSNKDANYLLDWFGDREVWFPEKKGDVFTGSLNKMLEAFDFLAKKDHLVFWRLKEKAYYLDPMGNLSDYDLASNEIGVFATHYPGDEPDDENEIDVIEQMITLPESWYHQHKDDADIRASLNAYMDARLKEFRERLKKHPSTVTATL